MRKKAIEITKVMSLRGPNIWTYRPALEAWVDIGELEDYPSNKIPGFYERLTAMLPGLAEHRCGVGEPGGFLLRLREGTWPAHIMEHVMIELQNLAGMQTGFGKARETSKRGVYKLVVRARHERVSRAALQVARDLVMAAINDDPFDVPAAVTPLRAMADSVCLGPSTACIVDAASERQIPSTRLNDGNLVQLGYGIHQRRIWTAETDRTPAISESISSDKDLTKTLLRSCGVPVPEGRAVESPADAWEAAQDIGLPVVVKPTDGNHGRGVATNLTTQEQIEAAYEVAINEGSEVLVEKFIPGHEHRVLVVGGKVVACARGEIVTITGDGRSTVAELIETQVNTDPRRGDEEEFPMDKVVLERDHVIRLEINRQGFAADSVPPAGREIVVQRTGNMAFDITEQVHPDVAAIASLAARVVGLDIAGIDLVTEDISRPLEETGGAIVEINAGPGLLMHLKPVNAAPRPVGEAIVEHLFGPTENGRIPVVGLCGSHGTALAARLIARLLHLNGSFVGLAGSEGLYLNQRQVEKNDSDNWESGRRVLLNKSVDAAVIENNCRTILSEGLAYDRCQVGVVTSLDPAATLPEFDINDAEQLAKVMRTQVDVVLEDGAAVLNAADANVAALAPLCDGEVVFYGVQPDLPQLQQHLAAGGRAVFMRDGLIVLARGAQEEVLSDGLPVPDGATDDLPVQLEGMVVAAAAAWALSLPVELIRSGIETFADELTSQRRARAQKRT
ncbi:cyanophycin synthetase [Noviherbaspirillum humi]|uniref:Cyanophycin synthetase n=1 Tax=Noviherbaspirillum humi TaxID=1688639 RepID=A0A239K0L4_9BURK|nr:cyanophycin synthetase [Noviherbaspirillum humi]SNT11580.1 cyanophycin synthetase [Noviherbaspirillum humi]